MKPVGKHIVPGLLLLSLIFLTGCGKHGGDNNSGGGVPTPTENVTLTVDKFGEGAVTSDISGIDCGSDCSKSYPSGTTVVLTAAPNSGSQFSSWAGCDSASANTCTVTMNANRTVLPTFALIETVIPETTKVLDDTAMQYLVKQEGSTYYFDSQATAASALKPGDVMASSSGQGLLLKVTAVSTSPDGLIAVETAPATLEDAIEKGTITFTKKLTHADLASAKALKPGVRMAQAADSSSPDFTFTIDSVLFDNDGNPETTSDQVKAVGSATFSFDVDFAVSLDFFTLQEFKTVFIVKNNQSLAIVAGGSIPVIDKKVDVYEQYFAPISISILVVVPKVTISVGVNGEVEATLSSTVTMDATYTAGVHYKDGEGWKPVSDYSSNFGFDPPNISAGAQIKGYVGPDFSLLIDGITGPSADLEGYLKVVADLFSTPWWNLYGGISASAGATVEILSWTIAEYTVDLFSFEWLLTSAASSADISPPSVPTGITATAVSSSQIDLAWIASTDNVGVSGYKVYRNGSYLKSVTGTSTSDTGLSPSTQYCYTVSAYDAANNESAQSSQKCATTQAAPDTTAPSVPTGLTATMVSSSQINLSWTASTDNVGVAGYKIYRGGSLITSVTATSYSDTGLSPSTQYCYTVSAYDVAGNPSAQSGQKCTTTGSASDTTPPDTVIDSGPASSTTSTSATFTFHSTETGSTFECKLDSGSYAACSSPQNYSSLFTGPHTFSVRATDAAGNTDPTPAIYAWQITLPAGPLITGVVRDRNTTLPIQNARVFFYGSAYGTVFTDASGQYTFTASDISSFGGAISGNLNVGATGYFEAPPVYIDDLSTQPSLPVVRDISLLPGGTVIQGTVRDASTSLGIAGATVSFNRNPMSTFLGGAVTVSVQTGADGSYAIDSSYFNESGLTSGFSATLMVDAGGYLGVTKSISFSSYPVTEDFSLLSSSGSP